MDRPGFGRQLCRQATSGTVRDSISRLPWSASASRSFRQEQLWYCLYPRPWGRLRAGLFLVPSGFFWYCQKGFVSALGRPPLSFSSMHGQSPKPSALSRVLSVSPRTWFLYSVVFFQRFALWSEILKFLSSSLLLVLKLSFSAFVSSLPFSFSSSVSLSLDLSVSLSLCLSVAQFLCFSSLPSLPSAFPRPAWFPSVSRFLSLSLSVCLSACLPACLPACLSVCLFFPLSPSLSFQLLLCVSVFVSLRLFVFLFYVSFNFFVPSALTLDPKPKARKRIVRR